MQWQQACLCCLFISRQRPACGTKPTGLRAAKGDAADRSARARCIHRQTLPPTRKASQWHKMVYSLPPRQLRGRGSFGLVVGHIAIIPHRSISFLATLVHLTPFTHIASCSGSLAVVLAECVMASLLPHVTERRRAEKEGVCTSAPPFQDSVVVLPCANCSASRSRCKGLVEALL